MTDPSVHTPPPSPPPAGATPKKKGLSPLAWVGIGCGGLLVVGLIVVAVFTYWVGGKVKEAMDNPAMTAAKAIVAADPNYSLVEADEEEGILIIRDDRTGEVTKVGLDELEDGRITLSSEDGEEIRIGMEEGEEGEGAFTVRDESGNTRMRIGAGGEEDIPGWVPRYEGAAAQGTYYSESGGEVSGGFSFETADPVDDVLAYFAEAFAEAGLEETGRTTSQAAGARYGNLNAEGGGRTVGVMATGEGETTQVVVSYSESEEQ